MSLYFSLIIIPAFLGLLINNIDKITPKLDHVDGTFSGYTQDSIFVDVKWELSYNYDERHTDQSQEDLENSITYMMEERIEMLLMDMRYNEYLVVNGKPLITNDNGIKIKMFK